MYLDAVLAELRHLEETCGVAENSPLGSAVYAQTSVIDQQNKDRKPYMGEHQGNSSFQQRSQSVSLRNVSHAQNCQPHSQ